MFKEIYFYLSPYFLIRYYLRRDIRYFAKKYKFWGKILDVGCGEKPYEHFFKNSNYIGIDFESYSKNKATSEKIPNFYFDKKYLNDFKLPFDSESFDHAVSFQVIEHHKKPEIMVSEMARVIKSGGFILLSCPFLYALHEEPRDYQRYTEYKLRDLLEENDYKVLEIKKHGSWFSVSSTLANEQLSAIAANGTFYYFLVAAIYLPFFLFQYVCLILDTVVKTEKVFINYIILARKK